MPTLKSLESALCGRPFSAALFRICLLPNPSGFARMARVENTPATKRSGDTHPDIQEILAKRRETLNRVRADLRKVDEMQSDFRREEQKRQLERQRENVQRPGGAA
jgi:hypothetical protein